jgi:hypothetical protein
VGQEGEGAGRQAARGGDGGYEHDGGEPRPRIHHLHRKRHGRRPDAITTSNTCDTDGFKSGDQCTLRAAIQQANATAGADAINFNIPGTGVKTIAVGATGLGDLPTITDPVTINGYTQPGASPNTKAVGNDAVLKIELTGNGQTPSGLEITHVSGSSVVKGLVINRFARASTYTATRSATASRATT